MGNRINFLLPLTTQVDTAVQASRIVLTFDCESTLEIDDLVYQDSTTQNKVLESVNNTENNPVIGVVIGKPTITTCQVLVLGIRNGYTDLSIGQKIFLSTIGTPTSTKPNTGYMQNLGVAVAPDTVFFTPNAQRVLQA